MDDKQSSKQADGSVNVGRNAFIFIFITVMIDSMGISLIMPGLPELMEDITGNPAKEAVLWAGLLSASYALMQFVFSPILGNLSDRYGRRPILMVSLLFLSIDYVIMALAPNLVVLFIGRILAGISAATYATANAFIADISTPEKRAQNFGITGAAFGLGFVLGPALAFLVAGFGFRAMFWTAAILTFANFIFGFLVMPETLKPENRRRFSLARANPIGSILQIRKFPQVAWFITAAVIFNFSHTVFPSTWNFFTAEAFGWTGREIGASMAAVGVGFVIVQGYLIRKIIPAWGPARTAIVGLSVNVVAMALYSLAAAPWMLYAIMPLASLGAITGPALNGMMSTRIADDAQGELQGALMGLSSLAFVFAPLAMTNAHAYFSSEAAPIYFPGASFMLASLLAAVSLIPVWLGLRRKPGLEKGNQ